MDLKSIYLILLHPQTVANTRPTALICRRALGLRHNNCSRDASRSPQLRN